MNRRFLYIDDSEEDGFIVFKVSEKLKAECHWVPFIGHLEVMGDHFKSIYDFVLIDCKGTSIESFPKDYQVPGIKTIMCSAIDHDFNKSEFVHKRNLEGFLESYYGR